MACHGIGAEIAAPGTYAGNGAAALRSRPLPNL
jgi:hypothetical protein